ncbi:MAG TPA: hypothetical protein VLN47_01570, partial [Clostridiaceae bacterium]|nr:hypothetical protein [Clostridiaceae bacterium]
MPERRLIVDYRTPEPEREELRSLGFQVILSEKLDFLYNAVKGHPDLQFVNACNTLICHKGLSEDKARELDALGIPFILSQNRLDPPYPGHIILNAAISDDLFIHSLRHTDPSVLSACPSLQLVDVRQGYTRCSLAYVGSDSYVTSDTGISKVLQDLEKNVLLLPEGDVVLEGFSHGFIGGCLSRVTIKDEHILLVTGSLDSYRHGESLRAFLRNIGV